ncbi:hypothetical protein AWB65_01939 [Caballeronia humi]|uniref:Uncharacterized protein n=1 Tax=Caballeronia humi TaxID=326474 RepID=A0A158GF23_9BURK|nr:hypothetical protein AWB65_01939 [Caballeronia humi]
MCFNKFATFLCVRKMPTARWRLTRSCNQHHFRRAKKNRSTWLRCLFLPPLSQKSADERLLHNVMPRMIVAAFLEAHFIEQLARVAQHVRAAAEHYAVVFL